MNPVIEALNFRHACKKFNPEKKISKPDLDVILDAAHLSPSSFGMEPWKLLVLESLDARKEVRPACWNQPQVTDSSHVIVILAKPNLVEPGSAYIRQSFERRQLPEEMTQAYVEKYKSHMETEVFPRMNLYAWCSKQCYIALANMMTAAASMGIDSCPMEGFEKDEVERILQIDTKKYEVAVLMALGYRAGHQTNRARYERNSMVEFR